MERGDNVKNKILASTLIFSLVSGTVSPLVEASERSENSLSNNAIFTPASPANNTKEILQDGTIVETVYEEGDMLIPNLPTQGLITNSVSLASVSANAYGSEWIPAGTEKYSQKAEWTTIAAATSMVGIYMKIPHFSAAAVVINWVIANKGSWFYYTDKKSFRMAGATLQIKHEVTFYKDAKRTKKIKTQTYITNDRG